MVRRSRVQDPEPTRSAPREVRPWAPGPHWYTRRTLHDTPPVPTRLAVGSRTSKLTLADISASPPDIGLPSFLVMEDPRDVCPFFGWDDVARSGGGTVTSPATRADSAPDAIPIPPITGGPSLLPSSSTHSPLGGLCRSLSPHQWQWRGEENGVNSLLDEIERGRVVPLGRWRDIRGRRTLKPLHLATYLLVPACQQLMGPSWLVEHHGLYSTSPGDSPVPLLPSPRPPCAAGSRRVGSRSHDRSSHDPRGYRCPTGFAPDGYPARAPW